MKTLPTDILENILLRLPIEDTLQSKRVCKTWRRFIGNKVGLLFMFISGSPWPRKEIQLCYGDPKYERNIEKYYSENTLTPLETGMCILEPNVMIGSCNGLVCYKALKSDDAFVCQNPITGEACYIIESESPSSVPPVAGFGYVGSTNEYKVVRIYFKRWAAYVQVYTLGSPLEWRDKGSVPCVFSADETGIFANGALHWIHTKSVPKRECKILAFRLADEKFLPVPSPPIDNSGKDCNSKLILLGGNLCLVHSSYRRLDIWAFKKETTSYGEARQEYYYDNTWGWSNEYIIPLEDEVPYTPFVITKRNAVLLWQNGTKKLLCYDPKMPSTLQEYWNGDKRDHVYLQAIPHMNSLVSLEDLGETSHKPQVVLGSFCPYFVEDSFRFK